MSLEAFLPLQAFFGRDQEEGGSCATMKQWMVIRSVGNPKIWGICKGRELEQPHKVLGGESAPLAPASTRLSASSRLLL